ncbi:MAG TPA: selenium cofactor biosynthesis protein YqeC [Lachnospiraceae bacterium]|jgi:probable selenium-dependent hydroxylase accessory protein YqeC|nr:selenium cofactor biosynthesis protein YqeC [Lachnospiraceae bacterium]
MKIISFADGECQESRLLTEAFTIRNVRNPVISVVGAGGKTTLIMTLADEYKRAGRKAFVTTTTHMRRPESAPLVSHYAPKKIQNLLDQEKVVWVAREATDGKIKSPTDRLLMSMFEYRIPIVIEADGSKGLPCKAPAEHEPVILEQTDIVIGVLGMDAIGKTISEVCHRPEQVMRLLHRKADNKLTWQDIITLAMSDEGLRKGVAPHMRYILFFNKTVERQQKRTAAMMARALADLGQQEVYFGVMDK